jgi:hypothetical protein
MGEKANGSVLPFQTSNGGKQTLLRLGVVSENSAGPSGSPSSRTLSSGTRTQARVSVEVSGRFSQLRSRSEAISPARGANDLD